MEAGTGATTTELLGLASPGVSDEEGPVVLEELVLDLLLGGLVNVLLVVGDQRLSDGLTDGVDLRSVPTTLHTNTDVNISELGLTEEELGLEDLEAEGLGLDQLQGDTVHLEQTGPLLAVGNSDGGLLATEDLHGWHILLFCHGCDAGKKEGKGRGKKKGRTLPRSVGTESVKCGFLALDEDRGYLGLGSYFVEAKKKAPKKKVLFFFFWFLIFFELTDFVENFCLGN